MDTERDDLMTYEVTYTGLVDDDPDGDMSDEEIAAWSEALARAEYDLWLTAKADAEDAEDAEMVRLGRDLAELSIEELAEAARAAELLSPDSTWGVMTIAAYQERLAELEADEEESEGE